MTARIRALALALVLAGTPMLGALADTPHNDAGTGGDAPDRPGDAVNVSPGAYVGNLTPGSEESGDDDDRDGDDEEDNEVEDEREGDDRDDDEEEDEEDREHEDREEDDRGSASRDADWYRVNASDGSDGLACTSTHVRPGDDPQDRASVHIREPAIDAQLNATATSDGVTLAHVGPSPSGTLAGIAHIEPPRVTEYSLEIDVTTIDEAGGAGSEDEIPGACFGGNLEDDGVDSWTFHAEEGQFLYVSFGTEITRTDELVLEAPNGTEIGSIVSEDDIAIGAQTLPETGNYTLSLDAGSTDAFTTASSDYIVGFNLVDPEEEEEKSPCRPHCMS